MANKEINKVPLDEGNLLSILQSNHVTLRLLGRDPEFKYSTKTVERAIASGLISPTVLTELASYLKVSTDFLSGVQDLQLRIWRFGVHVLTEYQVWSSVISTNETDAYKVLHDDLLKRFHEEDIYIVLKDILPITNGTII